jgi:hypothetical protein
MVSMRCLQLVKVQFNVLYTRKRKIKMIRNVFIRTDSIHLGNKRSKIVCLNFTLLKYSSYYLTIPNKLERNRLALTAHWIKPFECIVLARSVKGWQGLLKITVEGKDVSWTNCPMAKCVLSQSCNEQRCLKLKRAAFSSYEIKFASQKRAGICRVNGRDSWSGLKLCFPGTSGLSIKDAINCAHCDLLMVK